MEEQCSDIFMEVFDSHCGGILRECHCGRITFDSTSDFGWEANELEDLMRKSTIYPDQYIATDSTVGTMIIGGVEIVYGCKCETAKKYENFIRNEAAKLAEYLKKYAQSLREKADTFDM